MKTLLLLLSLFLGSTSASFAQTDAKAPPATPAPKHAVAQSVAQPADTRMSEKDYYKMMYEQAKESASDANTITWSALGLVVAVIAIILTVQYFFNIRLNQADIERIRADMQTQIADSQTALLGRLSDIATTNLQTLEARIQTIDSRLQAAINRELDSTKKTLQETIAVQAKEGREELDRLSNQINTVPYIVSASIETEKGRHDYALQHYIVFAEARITPKHASYSTAYRGIAYLDKVEEFSEITYDKIAQLATILQKEVPAVYKFWQNYTKGKPVYQMVQKGTEVVKEYIEKQPI